MCLQLAAHLSPEELQDPSRFLHLARAALLRWRAGAAPALLSKCRAAREGRGPGEIPAGSCSPSSPLTPCRSAEPSRAPDYISQGERREQQPAKAKWRRRWRQRRVGAVGSGAGRGSAAPGVPVTPPMGSGLPPLAPEAGRCRWGRAGTVPGRARGEGPLEVVLR